MPSNSTCLEHGVQGLPEVAKIFEAILLLPTCDMIPCSHSPPWTPMVSTIIQMELQAQVQPQNLRVSRSCCPIWTAGGMKETIVHLQHRTIYFNSVASKKHLIFPILIILSPSEAVAGNQFHLFALDVCKLRSFAEVLEQVYRNDGLSKSSGNPPVFWEVRKHTEVGPSDYKYWSKKLRVFDIFSTSSRSILVELWIWTAPLLSEPHKWTSRAAIWKRRLPLPELPRANPYCIQAALEVL